MKTNRLALFLAALLWLPNPVLADTVGRKTAASGAARQALPVTSGAVKALPDADKNAELPAPVVLSVTPAEVIARNAVITVQGQNFGANPSGGRRVILTQEKGGMQVIPTIDSWKTNRITFKAPDLSGSYRLQVDNRSTQPLSNAMEIMLGVRQKDIRVDFAPVFGGTRLDDSSCAYFYLGPAGGSTLDWRTVFVTELPGFPRLIRGGDERKAVSKEWNEKKHTLYDIFITCYLRFESDPAQLSFDSANHLVFSVPYRAQVDQTAKIFWYNTQDADPYALKNRLLTEPMRGMLTIRVPLTVQEVAGRRKILSERASLTFSGDLAIKNPWPDKGLESQLLNEWATTKSLLGDAIAAKFASADYRMSIFGHEFTNLIQSLVGPEATILRFQTTGSQTMRVTYLD